MRIECILAGSREMIAGLIVRAAELGVSWRAVVRHARLSRTQKTRVRQGMDVGIHTVQELAHSLRELNGGGSFDKAG